MYFYFMVLAKGEAAYVYVVLSALSSSLRIKEGLKVLQSTWTSQGLAELQQQILCALSFKRAISDSDSLTQLLHAKNFSP